jgi:hypothetical protein
VLAGCALLAACGSVGAPSGTITNSGASGDKTNDFKFSACMRSHGVTNFPDPRPGGGIELSAGLNPRSPAFRSAQRACKQFLPNGGTPPATPAADRAAAVKLARCMRSHGVPEFPDPAFTPPQNAPSILALRGMVFAIPASVDPNSPAFKQAARACGVGLK